LPQPLLAGALAVATARLLRVPTVEAEVANADVREDGYVRLPSGLEYRDYRVGTGLTAEVGDAVTVKWTGRLADRFVLSLQVR
jgi:FKBP-type peptidyl-prolyl cis-trans isomerase